LPINSAPRFPTFSGFPFVSAICRFPGFACQQRLAAPRVIGGGKAMMQKSAIWMSTAFAVALAVAILVLGINGTGNKSIRLALELTARWSFVLFWLAYAGNAMATLFPSFYLLAGQGRQFGLSFAAAHSVHIALVVWLYQISARAPLSQGLFIFFAIGLFWTYLLAFLSFGGAKALGPGLWRAVRFLGMNYILIAFGRDFLLPVIHPKPTQLNAGHFLAYAPFAVASIAAPLLVLAVMARRRAT
jgi:hypothetical protein